MPPTIVVNAHVYPLVVDVCLWVEDSSFEVVYDVGRRQSPAETGDNSSNEKSTKGPSICHLNNMGTKGKAFYIR